MPLIPNSIVRTVDCSEPDQRFDAWLKDRQITLQELVAVLRELDATGRCCVPIQTVPDHPVELELIAA